MKVDDHSLRVQAAGLEIYFINFTRFSPSIRLSRLIKFLESTREINRDSAAIFCMIQSKPQLHVQVVPRLFENWLGKEKGLVDDKEMKLAHRALELCCNIHTDSEELAWQISGILTSMLLSRGITVQTACLDALIAIMEHSRRNQGNGCGGMDKVIALMRDEQKNADLKLQCGRFMIILIGCVNGLQKGPEVTSDNIRQAIMQPSSFRWASADGIIYTYIIHNLPPPATQKS